MGFRFYFGPANILPYLFQPPEDIKPLLDTLIYHHFFDTDAIAGELEVSQCKWSGYNRPCISYTLYGKEALLFCM